jgi:hypothetical protein
MTRFTDGIESGFIGVTSAQSSRAGVLLSRQKRFTGGGNITWSSYFPAGAIGVTATLYVLANGSAATSDRLTIATSAGSTTLCTFTAFGSANGRFNMTTVGVGTVAVNVSASWQLPGGSNPDPNAFVPFTAILSSVDTATDYGLTISFRRPFEPGT